MGLFRPNTGERLNILTSPYPPPTSKPGQTKCGYMLSPRELVQKKKKKKGEHINGSKSPKKVESGEN
uniref:Uncharacterized protein n=1 Tax=Anguilla anguilla TaxID=7936 RepID=A0A0E9RY05_ANGAN